MLAGDKIACPTSDFRLADLRLRHAQRYGTPGRLILGARFWRLDLGKFRAIAHDSVPLADAPGFHQAVSNVRVGLGE